MLDLASPPGAPRQQTLLVRLLRSGFALTPDNLRIDGGERIRTVGVAWCAPADALPAEAEAGLVDTVDDLPRTLVVRTEGSGDFSSYTLSIVANAGSSLPPDGFDPRLSSIAFSFKVECPSDFDCADTTVCPPTATSSPDIDYLAKDYQGFRRLMLDRLSLLVPGWTERSAADMGVALVELLAYAADNLSYRQDVIANEAYLATARQRISVRRHARLVDHLLHEGCNARAFVQFEVSGEAIALPAGTALLTQTPGLPPEVPADSQAWRDALDRGAQVFETAHAAVLDDRLNRLDFYTWGDDACCLARGTTRATLRGQAPTLKAGDLLLLEEVASPTTLQAADADRAHRWVVRLTRCTASQDPSGRLFNTPAVDAPLDITEVEWDAADALPFALCLSVAADPALRVSVTRANVVLADHGRSLPPESLGSVPPLRRWRPTLAHGPLTHGFDLADLLAAPRPDEQDAWATQGKPWWPASAMLQIAPREAMPRIASLAGTRASVTTFWTPQRDLLRSGAGAPDFVVEVGDDGLARLRFGDDDNGKRPDPDTAFVARYRIGNGVAGNVGAEAIARVVGASAGTFVRVRNPLPASGGVDAEDIEAARRDAPQAFRTQERAVTAADYAAAAERRPEIQRAAATFRWTGSWHTVFVTADRFGGAEVEARFAARVRAHLERFRMAGYDLEVNGPRYVPLDVRLHVCVKPDYFRADVLQAVQRALSSGVLPDGRLGAFHPDNFTFGQPVYLSRLIAAAQNVEGVDAVRCDRFQRLVNPDATTLDQGVIAIGALEIAQLANHRSFRERGRLALAAGGGK
ncbi:MAG: putative baseplate assembly protein [Solirubrobacteraceae bacterium]|nr:putative baseplate assembly protein [Solirubrobacteraceae bacterium]